MAKPEKLYAVVLLFLTPLTMVAQTIEPPTESDEFAWLRWIVIVLAGIVSTGSGVFYKVVNASFTKQMAMKDVEIATCKETYIKQLEEKNAEIARLHSSNEQLQKDKDELHKDIQDKVIPAITTATNMIQTLMG